MEIIGLLYKLLAANNCFYGLESLDCFYRVTRRIIDQNDRAQDENSSLSIDNKLNGNHNIPFIESKEEQINSSMNNAVSPIQGIDFQGAQIKTDSALKNISNIKMETKPYLTDLNTTNPEPIVGQKRSADELHYINTDYVNELDLPQLKRFCMNLQARVIRLEAAWIPSVEDVEIVQNTLNDMFEGVNRCGIVLDNNKNTMNAMKLLNIDNDGMIKLNKATATAIARSLIKHKFPNPPINFKLVDVDTEIIDAILLLSKLAHPNDMSSAAKIRRAISNYFATMTYRKKLNNV
ncbi:hypothetical protein I4U23_000010 [Adineta vaga]|nr:hypothetical protein I4U23_000010 [Adineta vaga]